MRVKMLLAGLLLPSCLWAAQCVELDGHQYCAPRYGTALVKDGVAYCAAGDCATDSAGNLYCSSYQGGELIQLNGHFYTGPGQCVVTYGSNVYCAKRPGGRCVVKDNQVKCDDGWVREMASRPQRCEKAEKIETTETTGGSETYQNSRNPIQSREAKN